MNNLTNEQTSKTISIIPVKFSEYAYSFFDQFSLLNFIIPENKTKNDKFLLAVAYSIYLCLFNKNSFNKVSMPLFLSHCKKSDGLRVCKNIKEYLANNKSPISIFFDENDIYFGERFDIKIEENIKKSTLVIIHSDGFSSREFCKREVLLAKQYERPIVLIDYLQNGENRLFPYLGNIRTIKIEKNINYFKLLFEIIKESIRIEFFRQKNNMIISIFNPKHLNYKLIPYAPELLTISFSTNKKEIIIYPNPLLGNEELKLLESQFPNKRFLTPILFAISSKKYISMLNNVSISFSVSETDKMKTSHDVLYRFNETLMNISRYLVACGAKIIYCGNFAYQKFNFLDILIEQFNSYKQWLDNKNCISTDFFEYFYLKSINTPPKNKLAEISTIGCALPIEPIKTPFSDELNLALSYSELRNIIVNKGRVNIFLGGKTNNYSGIMPGVLEEFLKAIEHKNAIFLIGAYGGITLEIINLILKKDNNSVISNKNFIFQKTSFYDEFNEYQKSIKSELINFDNIASYIKKIRISDLRNGLTKQENLILFSTDDSDLISFLILKGLRRLSD